jgi:branched-chain amino acid transport system substrate-binding protein
MSASRLIHCFASGMAGTGMLALGLLLAGAAVAEDVKIGVPFDVTGPSAGAVLPLMDAIKLAVDEINANGGILKGQKLQLVVVDSKSTVPGSVEAASKLVKDDNVAAMVGGWTSASLLAMAHGVTIPSGVMLTSPAATAPIITTMENNGFVFRTILSDAYQGWMLGKLAHEQGYRNVALTYINNDYGSGISDTFRSAFENLGGTVTAAQAHEPNKNSYLQELTALSQGRPEALILIAYPGSSGITIIKESIAHGFFTKFMGTDSLRNVSLIKGVGADNLKGLIFTSPVPVPGTSALAKFDKNYDAAFKTTANKRFMENTYDAVMLTALAIEQAGSTDRTKIRDAMRIICCAPGEVIEPGEWAKGKADIDTGKKIHYLGASGPCDFDENGDVTGAIGQFIVEGGQFKEVGLVAP